MMTKSRKNRRRIRKNNRQLYDQTNEIVDESSPELEILTEQVDFHD